MGPQKAPAKSPPDGRHSPGRSESPVRPIDRTQPVSPIRPIDPGTPSSPVRPISPSMPRSPARPRSKSRERRSSSTSSRSSRRKSRKTPSTSAVNEEELVARPDRPRTSKGRGKCRRFLALLCCCFPCCNGKEGCSSCGNCGNCCPPCKCTGCCNSHGCSCHSYHFHESATHGCRCSHNCFCGGCSPSSTACSCHCCETPQCSGCCTGCSGCASEDCCTGCTGRCTGCTGSCTGCTGRCTGCTGCTGCTCEDCCSGCTSCSGNGCCPAGCSGSQSQTDGHCPTFERPRKQTPAKEGNSGPRVEFDNAILEENPQPKTRDVGVGHEETAIPARTAIQTAKRGRRKPGPQDTTIYRHMRD